MLADAANTNPDKQAPVLRRKGRFWVYYALILVGAFAFIYYDYINTKDSFVNIDFYRILYEASTRFNQNLDQLDRMHQYDESLTSRRSLMPSYSVTQNEPPPKKEEAVGSQQGAQEEDDQEDKRWPDYRYQLQANRVLIERGPEDEPFFKAEVDVGDLLPAADNAVSLYLFADQAGKVLASLGQERTISVVDLKNINKELLKKQRQLEALISTQSTSDDLDTATSPSYSSHLDMDLSYGDFRVFLFPFTLVTPLTQKAGEESLQNTLYLVGLVPTRSLGRKNTGQWDVPLLIASLVSLFFVWSMLRLYLLPRNQPITAWFRAVTLTSSFSFFLVLVALLISNLYHQHLRDAKDQHALAYAQQIRTGLDDDLKTVFRGLLNYREFYQSILQGIENYVQTRSDTPRETSDTKVSAPAADVQQRFLQARSPTDMAPYVKRALYSVGDVHDSFVRGWVPNVLFTRNATSRTCINPACEAETTHFARLPSEINRALIAPALDSRKERPSAAFTAEYLNIEHAEGEVQTHVRKGRNAQLPHNILTVFAVDTKGNTTLPAIYYQEQNAPPVTFNLSHRDYYKRVRDRQGWDLSRQLSDGAGITANFTNVYVQRLLNINDGTRGTTVALPLTPFEKRDQHTYSRMSPEEIILGADVVFPSMSLPPIAPKDMIFMVVDRDSGDVLFHSDESRTLIENLFVAGHHKSALSDWIRGGLDQSPHNQNALFSGHYHGRAGRFALTNSPIDAWSILVFYPNASLDVTLTNQFLYVFVSMSLIMLALALLVKLYRQRISSAALRRRLRLPDGFNSKTFLFVFSMLLSSLYLLFHLFALEAIVDPATLPWHWVWIGLVIIFLILMVKDIWLPHISTGHKFRGWLMMIVITLPTLLFTSLYLSRTYILPFDGLSLHYQQVQCSWLNHERQEVKSLAISRFPNSITRYNHNAYALLPINAQWHGADWQSQLEGRVDSPCDAYSRAVEPSELPNLNSVIGVSHLWQWIDTYLLHNRALPKVERQVVEVKQSTVGWYLLLVVAALVIWWLFHYRVLMTRLYCRADFLQHIRGVSDYLREDHAKLSFRQRSEKLRVTHQLTHTEGIELMLLIGQCAQALHGKTSKRLANRLAPYLTLFSVCPQMQALHHSDDYLANVKILLNESRDGWDLSLWEFEACLQHPRQRDHLLRLVNEFSALTHQGLLNSFTLVTRFRGLQPIQATDALHSAAQAEAANAHYLAWAECLMDFTFELPEKLLLKADPDTLQAEIDAFPELSYLSDRFSLSAANHPQAVYRNESKSAAHWAAVDAILLLAEPLYRVKWEACSSAEKLALYNLAQRTSVNPANAQMIERLALQGLLRVDGGEIRLMNASFTQFVLNADSEASLNALAQQAQAGAWKTYRLPIGIIILLLIGGIALTSGESIYIIAASLAGVLGTIASVTNSANLLRGHLNR